MRNVNEDINVYKSVSYTHLDVYKRQVCRLRSRPEDQLKLTAGSQNVWIYNMSTTA